MPGVDCNIPRLKNGVRNGELDSAGSCLWQPLIALAARAAKMIPGAGTPIED